MLGRHIKRYTRHQSFRQDNKGISETFTVLPALAMVLIGFTIFSIIITTAYSSLNDRQEYIDHFELANSLLEKICTPNAIFTTENNLINFDIFTSKESLDYFNCLRQTYNLYDYSFCVRLSYKGMQYWIPDPPNTSMYNDMYASSKQVSVSINEVTIVPGQISVILWENHT